MSENVRQLFISKHQDDSRITNCVADILKKDSAATENILIFYCFQVNKPIYLGSIRIFFLAMAYFARLRSHGHRFTIHITKIPEIQFI